MDYDGHLTSPDPQRESVLFIEMLNRDRTNDHRGKHVSLLQGALRGLGIETAWRTLGVNTVTFPTDGGSPHLHSLSEEDRALVFDEIESHSPALLILTERFADDTWAELRARFPDLPVRHFGMGSSHAALEILCKGTFLESRLSAFDGRALADVVEPDFERQPLNALASQIHPFTHLVVGPECVYQRPVAANPIFEGVDLSACERPFGCSFCFIPAPRKHTPETPPEELAIRQVRAAEATANRALFDRSYEVHGVTLWHRLEHFLPALLSEKFPPSSFFFTVRIDEILAKESVLRDQLPRLAEAGHRICLWNVGLENFSQVENDRFNKGLRVESIDRCIGLLRELESLHPDSFEFFALGGFGVIMFTPWTRLEDLRINLAHIRKHDLPDHGLFLSASVQLLPNRPLTVLAEHDGLMIDGFSDHRFDSGCIVMWDQYELPWRFRHPETAGVFRISRRMNQCEQEPPIDEEAAAIRKWEYGLERCGVDRLDIFDALIDQMEESPEETSTLAILDAVATRLGIDLDTHVGVARGSPAEREATPPLWALLAERLGVLANKEGEAPTLLGRRVERIETVRRDEGYALRLRLCDETSAMTLLVEEARPGGRCYFSEGRFAISYSEIQGTDPRTEEPLFRAILRLVESLTTGA